jgi:hypothetical protein
MTFLPLCASPPGGFEGKGRSPPRAEQSEVTTVAQVEHWDTSGSNVLIEGKVLILYMSIE